MVSGNSENLFSVEGKIVVFTGGTGVLGSTLANFLYDQGAKIVLVGRNLKKSQQLIAEWAGTPVTALAIETDIMDRESLETAAREILETFGRIDCLINAAGGNHPQATTNGDMPFFDIPREAFQYVADLNLLGTVLPSQVFGRILATQGDGIILNVSSMTAFQPLTRIPAYSAAKAAVSNFTKWLAVHMAQEYSPQIRVNAIAPGFFLTEQNRFLLTDKETGGLTERGQKIIDHTPMDRFGEPGDLFGSVLWLLSPASKFVTGIVVPIDGGFSAYSGV